jgi:Atypical PilZ domain, cyclic di-GMP receptor
MPEGFLGDGLIFEEGLPVTWAPGPPADGLSLGRLNADNYKLLGAEASLDEVHMHEALKDESAALLHELQRLEYKVNILLRLTAELAMRNSGLPAPARVRLSPVGLEWFGESTPAVGETGLLSLYINPALPQSLKISCVVASERIDHDNAARVAQVRFSGLSEPVIEMLEKLIFRHHRRLVAGARLASN